MDIRDDDDDEMKLSRKKTEEDYVFVVSTEDKEGKMVLQPRIFPTCFAFGSIEEAPTSIPFLPLDASTEITKHGGYTEAVATVQQFLDSRLDAYTEYRKMIKNEEDMQSLLTPTLPVKNIIKDKTINPPVPKSINVGKGWKHISSVDDTSRGLLRSLEEEGVLYTPHSVSYSVSYLTGVAPYGDCLFLSIEQLLVHTPGLEHLTTRGIRRVAIAQFWKHYSSRTVEAQDKMDTTIRNLYFPSLKGGWGVSRIQSRRYVASSDDRDILLARIFSLVDRGMTWDDAAQSIYSQYADPVVNAKTYCRYMAVGNTSSGKNIDFLISLNFTSSGLLSVDNDSNNTQVAWGDDIVLESLASEYQRDIFVVLVGSGRMFFLPHRPNEMMTKDGNKKIGLPPWFLLMRSTGSDRGGDHYEPMICNRLRGDASPSLGSIGE